MIPISPFLIEVPQDTLDDLRERLRRTRWPEQVPETGVIHDNDYAEGGHFAIHERAEEMAADLREFFRPLRNQLP